MTKKKAEATMPTKPPSPPSKAGKIVPTQMRLTTADKAIIARLIERHTFLGNATDAVRYALSVADPGTTKKNPN